MLHQIYLKVFLLKSIPQEEALAVIASFIDKTLVQDEYWAKIHNENKYKLYCFNSFYPTESDGIYKKEKVYQIVIRSLDKELVAYLQEKLPKFENRFMKGLICRCTEIAPKHITKLYSITPIIVKGKSQVYWRDEMGFEEFGERIRVNLIKKYNMMTSEKLDEDFQLYNLLEILNTQPIAVPYKGIKLLADKIQMQVADNPSAQKLAYLALGAGAGECCSRGYGYVNARFD